MFIILFIFIIFELFICNPNFYIKINPYLFIDLVLTKKSRDLLYNALKSYYNY